MEIITENLLGNGGYQQKGKEQVTGFMKADMGQFASMMLSGDLLDSQFVNKIGVNHAGKKMWMELLTSFMDFCVIQRILSQRILR